MWLEFIAGVSSRRWRLIMEFHTPHLHSRCWQKDMPQEGSLPGANQQRRRRICNCMSLACRPTADKSRVFSNCSLCSSFCVWGILLTIAFTISNWGKYRNLETIQGRLESWYFTYSCNCSKLRTVFKGNFSPCLEMDPRSTFHVARGWQTI